MKIALKSVANSVYRTRRLPLALCLCAAFSLPLVSQHPSQLPPERLPPDEIVYGDYVFSADGDVTFNIDENTTRQASEHAKYHLHYYRGVDSNGRPGSFVSTTVMGDTEKWKRETITTKKGFSGAPAKRQIETITQTLIGDGKVNDQPSTLVIKYVKLMNRTVKTLVVAGGSSLPPQVYVQTRTQTTDENGRKIKEDLVVRHGLTLFVLIATDEWYKNGHWNSLSGEIETYNRYDSYKTPSGKFWETIKANWNLNREGR